MAELKQGCTVKVTYYTISLDPEASDCMAVCDYELGEFNSLDIVTRPDRIGEFPSTVQLVLSNGAKPDFIGNPLSWPICSERLIKAVAPFLADVEILSVPLKTAYGPVSGFCVLHTLVHIDALDRKKSDIQYFDDGSIECVYKVRVDSSRVKGRDFFRILDWPYELLISQRVADAIVDAKVGRGIAFLRRTDD